MAPGFAERPVIVLRIPVVHWVGAQFYALWPEICLPAEGDAGHHSYDRGAGWYCRADGGRTCIRTCVRGRRACDLKSPLISFVDHLNFLLVYAVIPVIIVFSNSSIVEWIIMMAGERNSPQAETI